MQSGSFITKSSLEEHFDSHKKDSKKIANVHQQISKNQKEIVNKIQEMSALNCVQTVMPYDFYTNKTNKALCREFVKLCSGRDDYLFENTYDKLNRYKMQRTVKDLSTKHKNVSYFR